MAAGARLGCDAIYEPLHNKFVVYYTNQSDFDGQGSGTPDCFLGWDGARAETLRDYKQC